MSTKLFAHRWQRILFFVLLSILGLLLVFGIFIKSYLSPILEKKIKTEVAKSSDNLYHINFSSLSFDLFRGRAVLYDISLQADTNVYQQKKLSGTAPDNLYELHVNRLVLTDLHPFTLYFKKKLTIGRITLNQPDLEVTYHLNQKVKKTVKDKRTLWQKISKSLKVVNVGEIVLAEVKLVYKDYSKPKAAVSQFKELDLKAVNLLIDSATQTDTSRFLYCNDIITELHNYKSRTADGMYTFKIKSVKLSTRTSQLIIAGINLQPAEAAIFFKKRRDDRMSLRLDSVKLSAFDYINFQQDQDLNVSKLLIEKGNFEIFSNYNGTLNSSDRVVTFPNSVLKNLVKIKVDADTLDIKHINFVYKEFNSEPKKTGVLLFSNINGRFLNITNNMALVKKNPTLTAGLSSLFMGRAKLNVAFNFDLSDDTYKYSYKGAMAPMDLQIVNPITMPLALAKVTSGKIKSLSFAIHGNRNSSAGRVSVLYNDLKVDLLKNDYSKKILLTALANLIVLKHDNPDDGSNTPRYANVVYIRPKSSPFFKTVWQTLLVGIKACAGIGKAEEEKFNQQTAGKTDKEQEKLLKDAQKRKEQQDKDFKKQLEKQRDNKHKS